MKVSTRYDDGNDQYDLGAVIEGVFVTFVTVPGASVRGRVESGKAAQAAAEQQAADQPNQG